ncbi:expressed protein [Echinococcus multilocularis]|uniref:Expressed protein n=1 Tax=Echinococcus multilocularis TaxID=6211 RepID=A0A087W0W8_ECHMU|nr:expressed protein [Echinococcus multilocularis]
MHIIYYQPDSTPSQLMLFSLGRASGQTDGRGRRTTGRTRENCKGDTSLSLSPSTLTSPQYLRVCYLKSSGATVGQNQRQQQLKEIKRAG